MAILDKESIYKLYDRYISVVQLIREKNNGQSKNMLIKQIQIPVNLSHSIAYYYLINNPDLIGLNNIKSELLNEGSHRTYDLMYGIKNTTRIEVKATGTCNFQRFRQKAISSNLVIWLNIYENKTLDIATFHPSILNAQDRIEIAIDWKKIIKIDGVSLIEKLSLTEI
jgi:hypothetical protein